MDYKEAKIFKQKLQDINSHASKEINKFEKGDMGLTPDHVRKSPEYQKAKKEYDDSFKKLREFNSWFLKEFKKEYAQDRRNRLKEMSK